MEENFEFRSDSSYEFNTSRTSSYAPSYQFRGKFEEILKHSKANHEGTEWAGLGIQELRWVTLSGLTQNFRSAKS